MILDIITWPDLRLKEISEPVNKVDKKLQKFLDDMLETMYDASGIGLAAVQVGVLKRILVIDVSHGKERYPELSAEQHEPLFFINPEIIANSKEQSEFNEGCLSFPGQYSKVTRPESVTVKYLDYHGKEQTMEAHGILATCLQHEMDHLNGVVFVDHVSKLKRNMILKKLKKQQKFEE